MYWDIIDVQVQSFLILQVKFRDGTLGTVRFLPESLYGVFSAFKDPQYFEKVKAENGVLIWPNDVDLAPDSAYKEIKANGEWLICA